MAFAPHPATRPPSYCGGRLFRWTSIAVDTYCGEFLLQWTPISLDAYCGGHLFGEFLLQSRPIAVDTYCNKFLLQWTPNAFRLQWMPIAVNSYCSGGPRHTTCARLRAVDASNISKRVTLVSVLCVSLVSA